MTNNPDLSRRAFLAAAAGAAALSTFERPALAAGPSMKDAYKDVFLIGTALDFRSASEFNETELEIIKTQFNAMTPENSMKPQSVHPQENSWNWTQPDTLVHFCEENKITPIGHCLAWHSQTNPWFFQGATRELALERLKNHILTLVGHFRGKIAGWDVVNEAINDNGPATTENLRNSQWFQIVGPDFLTQAFKFAREADPRVALHYNDYNIESGNKHQSSLLLLKRLLSENAPVTVVGIQGHWSVSGMNAQKLEQIDQAIENYKGLGLKVAITELDLTMTGAGGGQLGAGGFGGGPRRGGGGTVTPEALQSQADAYAKLFALFLKHRDVINRVTFWGLNDRRSWRAGQNPLVFDGQNQPKPALEAIVNVAKNANQKAQR
ncbi:MAG TPA: endo-1,4-beta-xylanase [Terriglobia bacterium]|nr:endo-1,4-beta-xylanase [Terriglobia bacterium]